MFYVISKDSNNNDTFLIRYAVKNHMLSHFYPPQSRSHIPAGAPQLMIICKQQTSSFKFF